MDSVKSSWSRELSDFDEFCWRFNLKFSTSVVSVRAFRSIHALMLQIRIFSLYSLMIIHFKQSKALGSLKISSIWRLYQRSSRSSTKLESSNFLTAKCVHKQLSPRDLITDLFRPFISFGTCTCHLFLTSSSVMFCVGLIHSFFFRHSSSYYENMDT